MHVRQAYLAQTAQQSYLAHPKPTLKTADLLSWPWPLVHAWDTALVA